MSHMQLFYDRLKRGYYSSRPKENKISLSHAIGTCKVIYNPVALDSVAQENGQAWDVRDVPSLAPLYPNVFTETLLTANGWRGGALIITIPHEDVPPEKNALETLDGTPPYWALVFECFVEFGGQALHIGGGIGLLDDSGNPLGVKGWQDRVSYILPNNEEDVELFPYYEMRPIWEQTFKPVGLETEVFTELGRTIRDCALYTIGLAHARNIALDEQEPQLTRQIRRRLERNNEPAPVKYYMLKITAGTGKGQVIGAATGKGANRAFHSVRGHYRQVDSLFGDADLAGTYFIPSHVRGRREHGEIDKRYLVTNDNLTPE